MKGFGSLIRILIRYKKIKEKKEKINMKKRIFVTTMAVTIFTLSTMTTALAHGHGHGGGHHGGYYGNTTTYTVPNTTVPETTYEYSVPAQTLVTPLVSTICGVDGCAILGVHSHDNCNLVTHYYGDGHDYHNYYDHYYGDGHGYHHIGEIHH